MKQKELERIFNNLKNILSEYSPPLFIKEGLNISGKKNYELVSNKEVKIYGRKKKEVYFAGLIIQKGYVGFYYMLVYIDKNITKKIDPNLLKTLKGKTCFYIKSDDKETTKAIKDALKIAFDYYKKQGWI